MKTILSLLAFAFLVTATPLTSTAPKGVGEASKECGENVISCCNPTDKQSSSGVLSGLFGPIASNGCLGVSANAVDVLDKISDTGGMCGDNTVKCCEGNKNTGVLVLDLQCTDL